ncbi:hypothetical protein J0H58_31735, partial [bacterium]|nr:hypothetical protein [bacterium]
MIPVPPRSRLLPALLVAYSVALLGYTVWEGRALGLHRLIPHALDKHETSIAVAVSDLYHHLNRGYACYRRVHTTLENGGWAYNPYTVEKNGYKYPENMRDHALLDCGLRGAVDLPDPAADGVMYCPVYAEDVGYADFAKLGFRVFGPKISSLYGAYFLIMGATLAAYLFAYRRDVPMLLLLVGFQTAFFFVVRSLPHVGEYRGDTFGVLQLGTVTNGRFLCTLGLIPFLHLAGCLLAWPRPTAGVVVPAVAQAVALGLSLHFRGSAVWLFAVLFLLAGAQAAGWAWRNRRGVTRGAVDLRGTGRGLVAVWPLLLVAAGFAGQKAYIQSAVHWTYLVDDGLPNHLFWHNALIGLSRHPRWEEQPLNVPGHVDDALAVAIVERRLESEGIDKGFLITPLTRLYKPRLHDRLCGQTYLRFARQNPRYMVELMGWYKPKLIATCTRDHWRWVRTGLKRPDGVALLAGFGLCLVAGVRSAAGGWRRPAAIVAAGFAGSLVPFLWAYPSFHVMSEYVIMLGLA